MLIVKLEVNGRQVNRIEILNITECRPVSDYQVKCDGVTCYVRGHERDRGAQELVKRAIMALQDAVR